MVIAKRRHIAVIQMALGACLISFAAVFVKLTSVSPTTAGFYRVFFAAIVLLFLLFIQKKPFPSNPALLVYAAFAALFFSLDLFFWHYSIRYIGPGLATILGNGQVFVLALIGWLFYKEQLSRRFLFAVILAFVGLTMLVGIHWELLDDRYKMGVFFGLLTALGYGSYVVVLRQAQLRLSAIDPMGLLTVVCFGSSIYLAMIMRIEHSSFAIPSVMDGIYLLANALVAQVIGWLLITRSVPFLTMRHAGLLLLFQPSLSFLWDILFFGRPTTLLDLIGATVTLFAIYLGMTSKIE